MAQLTAYFIVPFIRGPDGDLSKTDPEKVASKEQALSRAEAMIDGDETAVGAIVWARSVDPRVPNFAAMTIVGRFGEAVGEDETPR